MINRLQIVTGSKFVDEETRHHTADWKDRKSIFLFRHEKVMLDRDYDVSTSVLNQAVK